MALDVKMMKHIYPDLEWYSKISEDKGLSPRCPYANVHRCPRYYSSLYLLGKLGITTKINNEKISELDEYWSKTDLLPVVGENDPAAFSSNNKRHNFTNFCPEITFDVFGLFASSLFKYTDEIDQGHMHSKLIVEAEEKDWRWDYSSVNEMHFINCPVYSQILTCPNEKISNNTNEEKDIFIMEPKVFGMGIRLKQLFKKFRGK